MWVALAGVGLSLWVALAGVGLALWVALPGVRLALWVAGRRVALTLGLEIGVRVRRASDAAGLSDVRRRCAGAYALLVGSRVAHVVSNPPPSAAWKGKDER